MAAAIETESPMRVASALPLVAGARARPLVHRVGGTKTLAEFIADVHAVAHMLPPGPAAVNLCDDRYAFLVGFCALALNNQVNLLPPSRTPQAVTDVLQQHPGAFALSERALDMASAHCFTLPPLNAAPDPSLTAPTLPPERIVAIGYTSGSTGAPKANLKSWAGFAASTRRNAALLREICAGDSFHIVATVPPQHMYGMEMTVLLPLLAPFAVDGSRPLFPADVARALARVAAPRLLVTTPVHLRALVADGIKLPPLAGIVSATAPLPHELAAAAETRFGAPALEVFGSTETCVIAHRRAAREVDWTLYDDVNLKPQPDGTLVDAGWFAAPVFLQDIVELLPPQRFRLCGRNADLLEIAGKRASLGDLTRRLLALRGVEDGIVFQLDVDAAGVRRVAALVVAPTRTEAELLAELRLAVDPAFLPRPLKRVDALPRNDTGKLPRTALLAALSAAASTCPI